MLNKYVGIKVRPYIMLKNSSDNITRLRKTSYNKKILTI